MFRKTARRNFQARSSNLTTGDTNEGGEEHANKQNDSPADDAVPQAVDNNKQQPSSSNKPPHTARFTVGYDSESQETEFQLKKSKRSQTLAEKQRVAAARERSSNHHHHSNQVQPKKEVEPPPENANAHAFEDAKPSEENHSDIAAHERSAADDEVVDKHEFRRSIENVKIPNAKLIFDAKRQRHLARMQQHADDVIVVLKKQPVSSSSSSSHKTGNSRLVREEDEGNSDDDDFDDNQQQQTTADDGSKQARVRFMAKSRAECLRTKLEMEAELDERIARMTADDEESLWEHAQFKKVQSKVQAFQQNRAAGSDLQQPASAASSLSTIPSSIRLSVTLISFDDMKSRVGQRLQALDERCTSHKREQTRIQDETLKCDVKITQLEKQLPLLAGECDFYKEMLDFVHAALECYSTKTDEINKLQSDANVFYRTQQELRMQNRKQFIKDMDEEVRESCTTATANGGAAAAAAVGSASVGRERKRRLGAHEIHRAKLLRRMQQNDDEMHADISAVDIVVDENDDEFSNIDDDDSKFEAGLAARRDAVFADTHESFSSIEQVCMRFERWSQEFKIVYDDAYVDECLAKLLTPCVKWQLTGWLPWLTLKSFSEQSWFQYVLKISSRNASSSAAAKKSLAQLLVENVVLEVAAGQISSWDPYSTAHTRELVAFIQQLSVSTPPMASNDSTNVVLLLKNIKEHAAQVITSSVYFPLYPRQMLESNALALSFYNRQFWSAAKLFGNLLLFYGLLSNAELKQLAVTSLLNRYLMMPLRTMRDDAGSLEKACYIGELLPKAVCEEWCLAFGDAAPRYLQEFTTQCYAVAKANYEKLRSSSSSSSLKMQQQQLSSAQQRRHVINLLLRMVEILKKLKDFKSAQLIENELDLSTTNG